MSCLELKQLFRINTKRIGIDAGGSSRFGCRPDGLGHGLGDVTADHERGCDTRGSSFEVDVESGEIGWIEADLDASTDECCVDGVTVPLERDRCGLGE